MRVAVRWSHARALSWLLIASLSIGCAEGQRAHLEIELAPTFAPGAANGDRACGPTARASLPSAIDCVGISACRREGDRCIPVRVLRPSDSHETAIAAELLVERAGVDNEVEFDMDLRPGFDHELEIRVYAGGTPYARGRVEALRTGGELVRVRLEPYAQWSCAAGREDGAGLAARALHEAVALPGGDVLLLGGVTGESIQAVSTEGGAFLQRAVEVYDHDRARFREVAVEDIDGAPGIGVVFHRARYVETMDDGRHRVRVFGGFRAEGQAAVRFDAIQGLTQYSSPLLPGARALARETFDVLYDPLAESAEVVPASDASVPSAGMNDVSEPNADGVVVVALGLLDGGGSASRPLPALAAEWLRTTLLAEPDGGASPVPMLAARFGHTASHLDDGSVLFWGGNVAGATIEDVSTFAGERIAASSDAIEPVLGSAGGLPGATAFHSATPIEGGVLVAGGMEVAPVVGMSGGITTTPSAQPLTVFSVVDDGGLSGAAVARPPAAGAATIFHAATPLTNGSVLLTGGARRAVGSGAASESHLWASDAVVRVARGLDGAYEASNLAPMIGARWGHAAATLPGERVLVTGGFSRQGATLRAIESAEILFVGELPAEIASCGAAVEDELTLR